MEQLTKDEAAKQLEEMEIRAKELRNIIAAPDIAIPIGTLGYVSSSDPDERYIVRLRRFSHMDDGYFYCWLDVSPDGETQPWEYFTPLPEAILPTMTKHDGGDQVKDTVQRMKVSEVFGRATGSNVEEQRVRSIQKVLSKIKGKLLFVVNYYIPVELSTAQYATDENGNLIRDGEGKKIKVHDIRIPSPADDFRKVAINLDGSNWFMTEEGLNSPHVQKYFALFRKYADFRGVSGKGPRGWDVEQSEKQSQKLVEWAMEELRHYLVRLHTSMIKAIDKAEGDFQATEKKWQARLLEGGQVTDKETTAAWSERNNRVRSELKEAAECLAQAVALAEKYDATECVEDLFGALRQAIRAQRIEFNKLAERLGVKGSDAIV